MNRLITLWLCLLIMASVQAQNNPSPIIGTNLTRGENLRVLRLAVSTTGEYTQATGGVEAVKAQIATWLPQINETYGREYCVRFELIPNNDQLIFPDSATDSWPTLPSGAVGCTGVSGIQNSQAAVIDEIIGPASYDFSHVIAGGVNGGCAGNFKGGLSGGFDIGVTRHEMGHQFGQPHTISNTGPTNYEAQNNGRSIQGGNVVPFAHSSSFHQLVLTLQQLSNVGTRVPTNNNIPTINAGLDRAIPVRTPFVLTAIGNDGDAGDTLTYAWDQLDGATPHSLPPPDDRQGSLFSRFVPTRSNTRTFPTMENVLNNQYSYDFEHLPTQAREINFRVTVNDNHKINYQGQMVNASGINSDDVKITVVDNGGAFEVTSPNTALALTGGNPTNITWNVAGTNLAPISTANIRISLSTDGGQTFPSILLNSTPNDGTATVTLPNISTTTARIKVEAIDNVYFDVSNQNFTINQNPNTAGVAVQESQNTTIVSETGQTDTYTVGLLSTPTGPVTITLAADNQVEISINGSDFLPTQTLLLNNTTPQTVTIRGRYDTVIENAHTGTVTHIITATNDPANYPINLFGRPITANVSDAQIPPVVGVDFDVASSTNTPLNWRRVSFRPGQNTQTDIPLDDGTPTNIDFTTNSSSCGVGSCDSRWSPLPALPQHIQPLSNYGGLAIPRADFQATWSDLKPNTKYRVFVFTSGFLGRLSQSVSITGNGTDNPPPFTQTINSSELSINDQLTSGSSNRTLVSFGKEVTATAAGTITINITPSSTGGEMLVSAMAIQEVLGRPGPGPIPACPVGLAAVQAPSIQVVDATCATGMPSGGMISAPAAACPTGTTLQYSTDGINWSTTVPTYNQTTSIIVSTRCNCNTDNTQSSASSNTITGPDDCGVPICAGGLATNPAPAIQVTNSVCMGGQNTPNGGAFATPIGCPGGTTLQYSTDNGVTFSTTLPIYNQTTAMTVLTRCNCNTDNTVNSPTSMVTTVPGICTTIGGGIANCEGVTFTGGDGTITIANLSAEFEEIEIFGMNTDYEDVLICADDCNDPQVITNLRAGLYTVRLQMFGSDDSYCYREAEVTVTGNAGPPPPTGVANCDAVTFVGGNGQITISNLTAEFEEIDIFGENTNYEDILICADDCNDPQIINNLQPGLHTVRLQMFGGDGSYCYREQEVTVNAVGGDDPNPPAGDDPPPPSGDDPPPSGDDPSVPVGGIANCEGATFTGGNGQITVGNLTAANEKIEIIGANTNYQVVLVCENNCSESQMIPNLSAGVYAVKLQMFGNDGSYCYREVEVTVTGDSNDGGNNGNGGNGNPPTDGGNNPPPSGGTANCDGVTFTGDNGQITVGNLTAANEKIEIIGANTNYQVVLVCESNCNESQVIPNLSAGVYAVKLQMFGNDGSYCYREVDVTVTGGGNNGGNGGDGNPPTDGGNNLPPSGGVANCEGATFTGGNGQISLSNLTAAREKIEIIGANTNYQVILVCEDNCNDPHIINNLSAGSYQVKLQMFGSDGSYCYREETVQVGANVSTPTSSRIAENMRLAGYTKETDIALEWVHPSDLKKSYYVLEKSTDGENFETMIIKKAEAINDLEVHRDIDEKPNDGDNYYRVFTQFENGEISYSKTINVPFNHLKHLSLFPNPIPQDGVLFINLKEYEKKSAQLMIHNSLGQTIYDAALDAIPNKLLSIKLQDFEPGFYALSIQVAGRKLETKTFLVSRL